jgi:hypothetical protein
MCTNRCRGRGESVLHKVGSQTPASQPTGEGLCINPPLSMVCVCIKPPLSIVCMCINPPLCCACVLTPPSLYVSTPSMVCMCIKPTLSMLCMCIKPPLGGSGGGSTEPALHADRQAGSAAVPLVSYHLFMICIPL